MGLPPNACPAALLQLTAVCNGGNGVCLRAMLTVSKKPGEQISVSSDTGRGPRLMHSIMQG